MLCILVTMGVPGTNPLKIPRDNYTLLTYLEH